MKQEHAAIDSELLVAQYGWIRNVSRSLVRDHWGAEDVAQETVLAALAAPPPDARDAQRLRAWLGRVAFNLSRLAARQSARRRGREERAARSEALPSVSDQWESAAAQASVAGAITALDEPYRTAVELRYLEGLSTADIAERTGATELAVRKRLWRARGKLRASMEGECEGNGRSASSPRARRALLALLSLRLPAWRGAPAVKLAAALAVTLGATVWLSKRLDGLREASPVLATGAGIPGFSADRTVPAPGRPGASDEGRDPSSRRALEDSGAPAIRIETWTEDTDRVPGTGKLVGGRVIDLEGNPLAQLTLFEPSRPGKELGTSGADGRFAVRVAELPTTLAARGRGFGPLGAECVEPGTESWPHLLVAAPVQDLEGLVLDEGGGALAGAELALVCEDTAFARLGLPFRLDPSTLGSGSSDGSGRFALSDVPLAAGFSLRASLAGYEPEERSTLELAPFVPIVLRRIPSEALVTGFVRRPTGEAAGGAHVKLGLVVTRADEDGFFQLAPRGFLPESALEAWEDGREPARIKGFGALLRGGDLAGREVELVLGEELESLAGLLIDEQDGRTEGWSVLAFRFEGDHPSGAEVEPEAITRTDAGGAFRLEGLREGCYSLVAVEPDTLGTARLEPVRASASRLELRVRAPLALSTTAGRLSTEDGAPLAGALLEVVARIETPRGPWSGAFQELRADGRGRFELSLVPDASFALRVAHPSVGLVTISPASGPSLELVLARSCFLQVEGVAADHVAVLDGQGRALESIGPVSSALRFALREGTSPVLAVAAEARAVRFLRSGVEVGRTEIALHAGEIVRIAR